MPIELRHPPIRERLNRTRIVPSQDLCDRRHASLGGKLGAIAGEDLEKGGGEEVAVGVVDGHWICGSVTKPTAFTMNTMGRWNDETLFLKMRTLRFFVSS
jgi:hypothetical protein